MSPVDRSGARAAALVTQMAVMTIVGAGIGGWLDSRLSTGHGLLLLGLFGGFAAGMAALFRESVLTAGPDPDDEPTPPPGDDDHRPPDPPQ